MKVTVLNIKPLGQHPLNKYLWLVDYKDRVIIGKQEFKDNNYFEAEFIDKIEYFFMSGIKGWLEEVSEESIKIYGLI